MEILRWLFTVFVVFFLVFLSVSSPGRACHSGDLDALLGFSVGLDSMIQEWESNSSSSDCCRWPGVYCDSMADSGRRVIGLDLAKKGLRGAISDNLTSLDHLLNLNLSFNLLRGFVPHKLVLLTRLEFLDLSTNELSGSFPGNLSFPSIKSFNVSNNLFNGVVPILSDAVNLTAFDVSRNRFYGPIKADICNSSSRIQTLDFSMNSFTGPFPVGFGRCRSLVQFFLHDTGVSGSLPGDLFSLKSLKYLHLQQNDLYGTLSQEFGNLSNLIQMDLSLNNFSGFIPNVFDKIRQLESFVVHSNIFNGIIPTSLSTLTNLRVLNLRGNRLEGEITLNCVSMPKLSNLDLGSNHFIGFIPNNLSQCSNLNSLNLAKNNLVGEIPRSFKTLSSLSYLSLSNNSFTNISSALETLQHCRNLTILILTLNFRGGETLPIEGIIGFPKIEVLVIANCALFGYIPPWLAGSNELRILDLSWNRLRGSIPPLLGSFDALFYLDISNNSLSGEIPIGLTQLKSLIQENSSSTQASSMQDFPLFSKKNASASGLQYNNVGSFPSSLILANNELVGSIPVGIGNLKMLQVLDFHKNKLSGNIPKELSGMTSLENLDFSHNNLTGNIPAALTTLNFLSRFDVSFNNLVGRIPSDGQFLTFSSSSFMGNQDLCGLLLSPCQSENPSNARTKKQKSNAMIAGVAIGIVTGTTLLLVLAYFVVTRLFARKQEDNAKVVADVDNGLEAAGSRLVLFFHNKDMSINTILKSTNNFDQAFIIGCGGFGLVYKASLEDGRKVAIKRLSGDFFQMEREFQAEVETLSMVQHENLVLLLGYCKVGKDRLLIYSFMENGSLDYWLHERPDGPSTLTWTKRAKIAQGAARGLAYLHQSCRPNIIHRDIKSSNILLDDQFEAHLADFGLARLILPYDTHVTTDLVGTLGYIPPEYSQASIATFKGDIYSFGIVLLELLSGRRPVDISKPKGSRELVIWALVMKERGEIEVFDSHIYCKELDGQLFRWLEIACHCVSESPKLRPSSSELVSWLDSIGTE